jgi:tRNA(fMet)-specific endonuclease VapC
MRYLLDTNVWIHYLKHPDSPVQSQLRRTPVKEIAVCSIVWAELLHGARKYEKRDDRIARVIQTLRPFVSLPFDDVAARHYAEIRDALELRGEVIGPNDLLIAAIALAHQLIVVSNNDEFRRVPSLVVEDWSMLPKSN